MPDQRTLSQRLADGRTALLDEITQPPLTALDARATRIRHRRRARRATGVALAALALAAAGVRTLGGEAAPPPDQVATHPPQPAPTYAGSGITIKGLTGPVGDVPDLPGEIVDVEFPDPAHGYVIAQHCGGCRPDFARTEDGGATWVRLDLPAQALSRSGIDPDLIAFDGGRLVLTDMAGDWASADGGRTWAPSRPGRAAVGPGAVLRLPGATCGQVGVWDATGFHGELPTQPLPLTCWVAATSAGGTWWAGGVGAAGPAVASSADGGRTWRRVTLPDGPSGATQVQVAALGRTVYAVVLGPPAVEAIYRSEDGGRTFARTGPAAPISLRGEVVPLPDGRLLASDLAYTLRVSADGGRTFTPAGGDLPGAGRLGRTGAGWVVYRLFTGDAGWVAFSPDGQSWRKLQVH